MVDDVDCWSTVVLQGDLAIGNGAAVVVAAFSMTGIGSVGAGPIKEDDPVVQVITVVASVRAPAATSAGGTSAPATGTLFAGGETASMLLGSFGFSLHTSWSGVFVPVGVFSCDWLLRYSGTE